MKNKKTLLSGIATIIAFVVWTIAVSYIDIKAVGPDGSCVGFSKINTTFHELTGVNLNLYTITDWLSIIPFLFMLCFAFLGLIQLIQRKHLLKVDLDILILGGYYIAIFLIYAFFEIYPINYRPVLIDGILEPSYPSSTTMLVLCVMLTTALQLNKRIKNRFTKTIVAFSIYIFTFFMVIGRLLSGVHWITDIIGGIILSIGLVRVYYSLTKNFENKS